ncbi:carboxypeptidase-like regulatory domain-containing protein [Hymenobacter sp. BT683]|uniref:Carboxypeptidase-like regulatory domain-containing protein n=1 Tax=Hymenobacter jeongseonensis TaxID=2791027 RepID=A0ABS0IJJ7_9BACT|nr:carboxypeptidase-like regulatory domain-containing protein [Hymenobacter jeongseonensis]MBF9238521.1 carboxypeptidase-like regulatory domain-containing protein [Hymenobacter jeongseonensis]
MRCFLLIWFVMVAGAALAQAPAILRGQVLDAETHQPIPNAQVGVAGNRIGTSTNEDGRFALRVPPEYQREQLEVALLGYRKFTQALPPLPGPELRIELRIIPAALGEVQVTASVVGIVREAVARIPRNFPRQPTRLTGFYRESDNDPAGRPRYLVEGLLTVFKEPYQQRTSEGAVQIKQSRKVDLRPAGPVRIDWAGGPFIAHLADFVHSRSQFIDPAQFRHYDYRLASGSTFAGRPVYIVVFGPRPGNRRAHFAGRMYIDQDTYAFLGAEWHYTPAGLRSRIHVADARALRVAYQPYAGRWHLKTVWWQTKYNPPVGPPLLYFGEFLTTAIDTAQAAPAPTYLERAQYRDVFLHNAVPYDSAFWQSQTTLLRSEAVQKALLDQQRQQRADSIFKQPAAGAPLPAAAPASPQSVPLPPKPALQWLRRIRYGAAVGAWPVAASAGQVAAAFAPVGAVFRADGSTRVAARQVVGWWSAEYEVDIAKGVAGRLATRQLFGQFSGAGWEAGLSYQHNLAPRHRPIFGRAGLAYTRQTEARAVGEFTNSTGPLRVGGTRLNADELSLRVQSMTDAIQHKLGLGVELSHKVELLADVGYLLPLRTRTQLQVDEESGFFLTRRSAVVNLPSADVSLRVNDQLATALPWRQRRWLLSFGLLYRLF